MVLQERGERHGVRGVPIHPQRERHGPAHAEPRLEGSHRAAGVERGVAQARAALLRRADHAPDQVVVTPDVLRRRVQDVGEAVPGRVAEVRRGEGVVHRRGHARLAAQRAERLEIRHRHVRVRDRLHVEEGGAGQRRPHGVEVVGVDQVDLHPEPGHHLRGDRVGAAVELRGGDHAVPRRREAREHGVHAGHARGEAERGLGALEVRHLRLERLDRGVPVPARVGVARLAEGDRLGVVLRGLEPVGRGLEDRDAGHVLVDRRRDRAVDGPRREPLPLGHAAQPTLRRPSARGSGSAGPPRASVSASISSAVIALTASRSSADVRSGAEVERRARLQPDRPAGLDAAPSRLLPDRVRSPAREGRDGHAGGQREPHGPGLALHRQVIGALRHGALRVDHDAFVVGERAQRHAQRGSVAAPTMHRDLMRAAEHGAHERDLEEVVLGQEPRPATRLHDRVRGGERVEVGDVVARDDRGSLARDQVQVLEVPSEPEPQGREDDDLRGLIPGLGHVCSSWVGMRQA